jgi:hypothetical protein
MGLFGKLLLVVNLLATGGFVYLTVQDYKGRQTISAAILRHIILLNGLPLEGGPDALPPRAAPSADNYSDYTSTEIPFAVEGPGNVRTTTVSPELLYAYFNGAGDAGGSILAGNAPVASQMAEVKRVWGIIKSTLEKADGNAARAPLAFAWLQFQAETIEERNEYLDWAAKSNGGELTHALDIKFHRVAPKLVEAGQLNPDLWATQQARIDAMKAERDAALKAAADAEAGGNAAEAEKKKAEAGALTGKIARRGLQPPKDEPDRRTRLAHLLVHLDQSAAWQKRVAMIIGVKAYGAALDAQSGRFKEMIERLETAAVDDQDRFVTQYAELRSLAITRTQLVLEKSEIRAQLTLQAQKDQDLVNQRQGQLDDLTAQLAAVKTEVNNILARQTLVEQKLFEVERKIGLTLESIYKLEAELRQRERDRYQGK